MSICSSRDSEVISFRNFDWSVSGLVKEKERILLKELSFTRDLNFIDSFVILESVLFSSKGFLSFSTIFLPQSSFLALKSSPSKYKLRGVSRLPLLCGSIVCFSLSLFSTSSSSNNLGV